jgi:hypothetical protein
MKQFECRGSFVVSADFRQIRLRDLAERKSIAFIDRDSVKEHIHRIEGGLHQTRDDFSVELFYNIHDRNVLLFCNRSDNREQVSSRATSQRPDSADDAEAPVDALA